MRKYRVRLSSTPYICIWDICADPDIYLHGLLLCNLVNRSHTDKLHMPNDILSTIINWVVTGLLVVMTFMLRKIFFYDTKIAVLEQQLADRNKHMDEQLSDIKESIKRLETLLLEKNQ